jgi:2-keto-4-pentenoate hydratase
MAALDDPRIARGMERQFALRRDRIAAGGRPIGWKVGFGAPAAMDKFKLTKPLIGFLLDTGVLASGGTVSLAGWVKPVAEPEICIEMARDLPGGGDLAASAAAIGALGPAIELADLNPPPDDVETILAGDIFHRHVLFGPRDAARAGARLEGLRSMVTRRGDVFSDTADLESNTGRLVDIVRHVADVLAACGETLRAGDVIIAGSIVPPIFMDAADTGVEHRLDPIGSVSVRFAR